MNNKNQRLIWTAYRFQERSGTVRGRQLAKTVRRCHDGPDYLSELWLSARKQPKLHKETIQPAVADVVGGGEEEAEEPTETVPAEVFLGATFPPRPKYVPITFCGGTKHTPGGPTDTSPRKQPPPSVRPRRWSMPKKAQLYDDLLEGLETKPLRRQVQVLRALHHKPRSPVKARKLSRDDSREIPDFLAIKEDADIYTGADSSDEENLDRSMLIPRTHNAVSFPLFGIAAAKFKTSLRNMRSTAESLAAEPEGPPVRSNLLTPLVNQPSFG